MRFFRKIQDWILKTERIWKGILRFFTRQINPRSFRSWCVKGTEESTPQSGFFGFFEPPWSVRSWFDLSSKETQNPFSDSFGFKNPLLDFLTETHPYGSRIQPIKIFCFNCKNHVFFVPWQRSCTNGYAADHDSALKMAAHGKIRAFLGVFCITVLCLLLFYHISLKGKKTVAM